MKNIFKSKTVWGALIVIASTVAKLFGVDMDPDTMAQVGQVADTAGEVAGAFGFKVPVSDIATLAGAGLSIYGRIKAGGVKVPFLGGK